MSALYVTVPLVYFFPYFIFFSALIVTIRSDLETMLISRFVTLFLIPLGLIFSVTGYLPLSFTESLLGSLLGYFFLFATAKIFYKLSGTEGIGQGDLELLAFIGSFIGIIGCWFTLFAGSVLGSCIGLGYILLTKVGRATRIPFGPFLAGGALSYVLFNEHIWSLLIKLYS